MADGLELEYYNPGKLLIALHAIILAEHPKL